MPNNKATPPQINEAVAMGIGGGLTCDRGGGGGGGCHGPVIGGRSSGAIQPLPGGGGSRGSHCVVCSKGSSNFGSRMRGSQFGSAAGVRSSRSRLPSFVQKVSQASKYCLLHCGQYFIYSKLNEFETAEEIRDLDGGVLVRIGTVNGVFSDGAAELFSQRALISLCRISCTHQVAPRFDCALFLERHHDAWSTRHELRQTREEWAFAMDRVETFSLLPRHVNQF